MRDRRPPAWLWGRPTQHARSKPLHYPLLAVVAILAAIAPSSWLVSTDLGYAISGVVLAGISLYAVAFTPMRYETKPVFLVLLGGYWLGLVAHYLVYDPHTQLLVLIVTTPLVVFTTVVVLPQFVTSGRQTFTMALSLASAALALVGIVVLLSPEMADSSVWLFVGDEVMGLASIRTVSVFSNPNPYGFVMMIGSVAALYTLLVRGGVVWGGALALSVLGLVMSEGDAALVGCFVGAIVVLSGHRLWQSLVGIGVGVVGLYGMIRIGHVPEVMRTTLLGRIERWVASIELLAAEPLWGIGFADVTESIGIGTAYDHSAFFPPLSSDTGSSGGPHSSYVYPLLSTGVIAGSLYLSAVGYAVASGIRRRWTPWNAFVVGTASSCYVFMIFESLLLGGLSVAAVTVALFIGLMVTPERP